MLLAVSLACALMSSFLAVLGQQWLVYYRKRSGGGAVHQRKEQLRRQLGAQRWRLELVLDDILPGLLQVGLVIFCISFVLYLRTLSGSMSFYIAGTVGVALTMTVGAAVSPTQLRTALDAPAKAFAAVILHMALSVGTIMDLVDRKLVIKTRLQAQLERWNILDLVMPWNNLVAYVELEKDLQDGDLKNVNLLRLLGIPLRACFLSSYRRYSRYSAIDFPERPLRQAIETVAKLTASRQSLGALTFAVTAYMLSPESKLGRESLKYEQLSELFNLAKEAYHG
ncbi:hypothetical protein FS837_011267 [Tulasnella sp. UAMH 9824]|nr:hypothetical protein FS837_011267 [Tulasnella sp. UAMH 9824]